MARVDTNIDYYKIAKRIIDYSNNKKLVSPLVDTLLSLIENDKTGILNFSGFSMRYRLKPKTGYIIFMDLNNLKIVNDNFGHQSGDKYLESFISIMLNEYDNLDLLFARIGGDEFLAYTNLSEQSINQIFERINSSLVSQNIYYHVSYGIAKITKDSELKELITKADTEMYKNKIESKKGGILFKPPV